MPFDIVQAADVASRVLKEFRASGISYQGENSKARALSTVLSRELQNLSALFNRDAKLVFARYATDELLEALCAIFGIFREQATKAHSPAYEHNQVFYVENGGTFGSVNGGVDFTIPTGTSIWSRSTLANDTAIQYKTTAPVLCSSTATSAWANVEAVSEGKSSNVGNNVLVNHDFIGYISYTAGLLKTRNNFAIVNGQDRQTDSDLRYVLSIASTAGEAANESAIRLSVLAIPGVVDIKIIRNWDGIGTCGVFIVGQGNEAPPTLILQSQDAVDKKSSCAGSATAYGPPQVGWSMITRINLTEAITINEQNEIESALLYILNSTTDALRIGQSLNLRSLINQMLKVDSRIVSFGTNSDTSPFDYLYIYRSSLVDSTRIRSSWLNTDKIIPFEHEVIIAENSLTSPFLFTWEVYD